MYDHYCSPPGLGVDNLSNDDPFVVDKNMETFNADQKVEGFMNWLNDYTKHFKGNHVFVPMGCDFHYTNAELNYKSLDRLITYFN